MTRDATVHQKRMYWNEYLLIWETPFRPYLYSYYTDTLVLLIIWRPTLWLKCTEPFVQESFKHPFINRITSFYQFWKYQSNIMILFLYHFFYTSLNWGTGKQVQCTPCIEYPCIYESSYVISYVFYFEVWIYIFLNSYNHVHKIFPSVLFCVSYWHDCLPAMHVIIKSLLPKVCFQEFADIRPNYTVQHVFRM